MTTLIVLLVITLLCSSFFSGLEIAYISANKLKVELNKSQEQQGARNRILNFLFDHPAQFIGTTLLGNNIALIFFSMILTKIMEPVYSNILPQNLQNPFITLIITTLVSTVIVLIFGEYLPKNLFRLKPLKILSALTFPFIIIYYSLYIFVYLIISLTNVLLKVLFGIDKEHPEKVFTSVDLVNYVRQTNSATGDNEEIDTEMFERALDLPQIKVRECMIPRKEIVALDRSETLERFREEFIKTKLSRIIVFEDSIDQVVGYSHHLDMLKDRKKIYNMEVVPETLPARDLLYKFQKDRKGIALVADEFGGTAGLVTLEDIMEEIFGEIHDEHDIPEHTEEKLSPNQYKLSGRLEIDYLNEKYDLMIPEGEYETLSGFIVHHLEHIPEKNSTAAMENFYFDILEASGTRIDTVKMTVLEIDDFED